MVYINKYEDACSRSNWYPQPKIINIIGRIAISKNKNIKKIESK